MTCPLNRLVRMLFQIFCLCLLFGVCSQTIVSAQWGSATNYVNFTSAKFERLSNAVRIILEADGTLETGVDFEPYWSYEPSTNNWKQKRIRRMPFMVLNARSQIGRFVDVGTYPVSHLTLSVPTTASEGVGLELSLSLYVPARVGKIHAWGSQDEWAWWTRSGPLVDWVLSDNRRQLIITVQSDIHYDTDVVEDPVPQAKERILVERENGFIRLQSVNMPFERVMDEIGAVDGLSVTVAQNIKKRITADLPAMPIKKLLELICKVNCLNLIQDADNRYTITQASVEDSGTYWASQTRKIQLNFTNADDALLQLPSFLLKYIRSDSDSNSLVATGPPQLLDKIALDLAVLDKPAREIRIRALVIEVLKPEETRRRLSTILYSGTSKVALDPDAGQLSVSITDKKYNDIRGSLRSLIQKKQVRMHVEPEVRVLSGRRAELFIGNKQYFSYQQAMWWGGTELRIRNVNVGTSIGTTPWAGADDIVMLPYNINTGSVISKDSDGVPLISRQNAAGTLRMHDGDTLIFGGLRSTITEEDKRNSMPTNWLPGVRQLTENRLETTSVVEIIILLSAEVVPFSGNAKGNNPSAGTSVMTEDGNDTLSGKAPYTPPLKPDLTKLSNTNS